jgi:class 3 adenylate cyclase/tetratricopeptide (TPR) repeat protein
MSEPHPLAAAIADLEARRAVLGDAVVDAAIAALRAQLGGAAPAAAPPAPSATPASASTSAPVAAAAASAAAPAAAPAAPAAATARLRQVSILFADIADSTALLQRLSADEALDVVSAALERFAAVVRAAGGEVLRFTGDGLKAAFGAEGLREDEAEQAVRAGLGILDAARAHAAQVQHTHGVEQFGVRIGVHTGPVVLGAGVEADRSAMGHAVHLAARMEQSAPVGQLRISHETWALVRGLFRVEPQPPLLVKGHDEPLTTYLVLDANADPERAPQRGVEGVVPPMIGRDAELATLLGGYDEVAATRRPAAMCVVADAGVGKTRLRRELLQALQARAGGAATVLQARAHPSGTLQAYGLLRQLVARWFDIADDLDGDTARERLLAGVSARLRGAGVAAPNDRAAEPAVDSAAHPVADSASDPAAHPVAGPATDPTADRFAAQAERLGHLLGIDFGHRPGVQALGARQLREQGVRVLTDVLAAEAAASPAGAALVVVLDDLHWADAASVEVMHQLVATPALPVLWLLLTRPGGAVHAPPVARMLPLSPLSPEQGATLADALLAPLAAPEPALRELLIRRAEGNPFYMEELLRMLIDDGVVDARTRPWQVRAQRLSVLRVPETLVGVLQARLDALPAGELAALQQASIVGPVFWNQALAELDAAAPAALPALQRRAAVIGRDSSAFAQAEEFAFGHQLLHDVTYGTVLASQRRSGHARAAQWLAARIAGRESEFMALTAEHYERAGDSGRALECYDRARSEAAARFAHGETLRLIERALAQPALTDVRWRFQLLDSRYTVLHHQSRAAEAEVALKAIADFAEAHDDDAMRASVAAALMLRADHEGRPDEARAQALRALELAARSGNPGASGPAALAHGELAWLALQKYEYAVVEHQLALGIEQARVCATLPARAGGYEAYEVQLRVIQIDALQRQERHADCLRAVAEALQSLAGRRRTYPHDRFHLLLLRSNSELDLGRVDAAAQTADEMRALADAMQMPRLMVYALQQQSSVALRRGELERAQALAERAVRISREVGHDNGVASELRQLGEVALARGDVESARAHWDEALAMLQRLERSGDALDLRCLRAGLLPDEAARTEIDAALAEAAADPQPEWRVLSPDALLAASEVLARLGDARAAALGSALRQRRDEQLAQFDAGDRVARAQLLDLPWWRALGPVAGFAGSA